MNKTKKLALGCILLSMEEIKSNLESSALIEDVTANAKAMRDLAEAYAVVEKGR